MPNKKVEIFLRSAATEPNFSNYPPNCTSMDKAFVIEQALEILPFFPQASPKDDMIL